MISSRPQLIKNTTLADLKNMERCEGGSDRRKQQASKRPWSCTETGWPLCRKHGSSLDVYCCTDEQIICAVCASAEHMGHTIGAVKGERRRKQVGKQQRMLHFLTKISTKQGDFASSEIGACELLVPLNKLL